MSNFKNYLAMKKTIIISWLLYTYLLSQTFRPGFEAGTVYKEFHVMTNVNNWRVTDPNATHPGAQQFLPNPIINFNINDLEYAIKAEAVIDLWGGHVGTANKRFRVNNNSWINIPELNTTPTNGEWYLHQWNPVVEIPLSHLRLGANTIEGTSGGQTKYSWGWGQWGWYGIIIRIYYDPNLKSHTRFSIISPNNNSIMTGNPAISFGNFTGGYKNIEVVGYFWGYDNSGIGVWTNWHFNFHRDNFAESRLNIKNHIGTANYPSTSLIWNTAWYPDQSANSIKLIARIRDSSDVYYVCEPKENLTLRRNNVSFVLCLPYNVPENYWVRANQTKSSGFLIPTLRNATDAAYIIRTWNGRNSDFSPGAYRINNIQINQSYIGKKDFFAFTFLTFNFGNILRPFENTFSVFSDDPDHGIEVLWPGPAVMIRYNVTAPIIVYPPVSRLVNPGDNVQFSITALGAGPLNYQWKRNGQNVGENSPILSLNNIDYSNLGDEIQCVVSNHHGLAISEKAYIILLESNSRIKYDNLVHYDFRNTSGSVIRDRSLSTNKIDLFIEDTNKVEKYENFLRIKSPTRILNLTSIDRLIQKVKKTNEITIELWIRPDNLNQNGPARIVTISDSLTLRNITVGQGTGSGLADRFQVRVRTTSSLTDSNGLPGINTPSGSLTNQVPTHFVYTRNQRGLERIYINGILSITRATVLGEFLNWNDNYNLCIGNEINADRPWLGDIYLLSIYSRALTQTEVEHHYNLGYLNAELPVTLVSFDYQFFASGVLLKWKTSSEVNNLGFEIQRSDNFNESFKTIGFIKGAGNSNIPREYKYEDLSSSASKAKVYYRLKQIDYDGNFSYSKILEADLSNYQINFDVEQNYPNPFNASTTIKFHLPSNGYVSLFLYDLQGKRLVVVENKYYGKGKNEITIDAKNLSSGIYLYKLEFNSLENKVKYEKIKKAILIK